METFAWLKTLIEFPFFHFAALSAVKKETAVIAAQEIPLNIGLEFSVFN